GAGAFPSIPRNNTSQSAKGLPKNRKKSSGLGPPWISGQRRNSRNGCDRRGEDGSRRGRAGHEAASIRRVGGGFRGEIGPVESAPVGRLGGWVGYWAEPRPPFRLVRGRV